MKKNFLKLGIYILALAGISSLSSCDNNNSNKPNMKGDEHTFMVENVVMPKLFVESGSFVGVGSAEVQKPIILPGQSVEFKFKAGKGQALMFVTMYGNSKDWFFASEQPGIMLYDKSGKAITGDVSSQVKLWDNGTKNDMTGAMESMRISEVKGVDASKLMKVMLAYDESSSEFTLSIMNKSGNTDNETPFSPGVWAVSTFDGMKLLADQPFFMPGKMSNPEITDIAQMGDITKLKKMTEDNTGIITGISPVLVVVYQGEMNPIFQLGKKDSGMGLKDIAQMGDASKLTESLKKMNGVKGVYLAGNAPVGPGKSVMVKYNASKGDKLAFVTMFGFSNDWFYGNKQAIAADMTGDVTMYTGLFDSGTGVDQYPGAGNKQALFGGMPEMESKPIQKVGNMYPVPSVDKVLKITIK